MFHMIIQYQIHLEQMDEFAVSPVKLIFLPTLNNHCSFMAKGGWRSSRRIDYKRYPSEVLYHGSGMGRVGAEDLQVMQNKRKLLDYVVTR